MNPADQVAGWRVPALPRGHGGSPARKAAFDGLNMAEVERITKAIDSMLEQRVQTTKAGA